MSDGLTDVVLSLSVSPHVWDLAHALGMLMGSLMHVLTAPTMTDCSSRSFACRLLWGSLRVRAHVSPSEGRELNPLNSHHGLLLGLGGHPPRMHQGAGIARRGYAVSRDGREQREFDCWRLGAKAA